MTEKPTYLFGFFLSFYPTHIATLV